MNEKNLDEIKYRRQAFKFFDKGKSTKQILKLIPRSRSWLFKWKQRLHQDGWEGLDSLSKTAKRLPHQYAHQTRHTVLRVRQRLEKQDVGLVGWRFVWRELQRLRLLTAVPSASTIKRWLREAGCGARKEHSEKKSYYPAFRFDDEILFASADWIARYIKGGAKVFVFHTVDLKTHALCQSIETNKSTQSACAHLVQSLRELGLIDFLQLDNDAAFTGLGKRGRIFGRFVRVALYFGVELVFIPPGEPKRNAVVERVNGLWARAFWDKNHFASVVEVSRKSRKFLEWYLDYAPPALHGASVAQASKHIKPRKSAVEEISQLPDTLPLTTGRLHYIRQVDDTGCIEVLKEKFKVSKSLRGHYVWATTDLRRQSLTVFYRRSAKSRAQKLKEFAYHIEEPMAALQPRYKRPRRTKVNILKII